MSNISAENPLGVIAIDHLEFCADTLETKTKEIFYKLGFEKTFEKKDSQSELFSQGQIRFLLTANKNPESHARHYFSKHGEGVSKISFLVEDAELALKEAEKRGAKIVSPLFSETDEHGTYKFGSIQGFGDVVNEFVERPRTFFRKTYAKVDSDPAAKPLAQRFSRIDHLTNNVPKGEMKKWVEFYTRIFGMKMVRYFDIKGAKTGLESEVVSLPNGIVIIPINEPDSSQSKSQIQEFLDIHKGAGVQHIALMTADLLSSVGDLQERGIRFLDIPDTYYEQVPNRPFKVDEDVNLLKKRQVLVDGDQEGYLLQNFTDTYIGPLFFEIIQRKKHNGFGEGNFQALFDSIELDQIRRGYIK